jgi:hypothetical protein
MRVISPVPLPGRLPACVLCEIGCIISDFRMAKGEGGRPLMSRDAHEAGGSILPW